MGSGTVDMGSEARNMGMGEVGMVVGIAAAKTGNPGTG